MSNCHTLYLFFLVLSFSLIDNAPLIKRNPLKRNISQCKCKAVGDGDDPDVGDGVTAVEVDAVVNVFPGLLLGVEGGGEDEGVVEEVASVAGGDKSETVLDECQRNEGIEGDGEGLFLAKVTSQRVVVEDHLAGTLTLDILNEEDQLLLLETLDGTVNPILGDPKILPRVTVELVGGHAVSLIAGEDEHHPALIFVK